MNVRTGWSQSKKYSYTVQNGYVGKEWWIYIEYTNNQWQTQFPITPLLHALEIKKYVAMLEPK